MRGGVRGVFSSVSGFTGFINRSIAQLSFDDRIIARQAKEARQKPKHVLEGLGLGLTELTKGVVKGVSGVVTRPIRGAMEEGGKGFVTGLGKGLVGESAAAHLGGVCG